MVWFHYGGVPCHRYQHVDRYVDRDYVRYTAVVGFQGPQDAFTSLYLLEKRQENMSIDRYPLEPHFYM